MSTLPLNIEMGALPASVLWTPQQLGDAIAERLRITTQQTFALFVSGSTEPSSNVGPWLRNGTEWYVWSDILGAYEPITIPSASLGYWIGPDAPDGAVYSFWIETAAGGSPLALKTYFSGAWVDVYATTLAAYLTIASAAATYQAINANLTTLLTSTLGDIIYSSAANTLAKLAGNTTANKRFLTQTGTGAVSAAPAWAAILAADIPDISATYQTVAAMANYYTTAQTYTQAEVNALVAGAGLDSVPSRADSAGNQNVAVDGTPDVLTIFTSVAFGGISGSAFTAPATGVYEVSADIQIDNVDGTAASMEVTLMILGNSVQAASVLAGQVNNAALWAASISGLVSVTSGQTIEIAVSASDGVGTGNVTASNGSFSVHRVQ